MVFFKAVFGDADGAEQAHAKVHLAVDVIDDLIGERVEEEAVDGEVAALGVEFGCGVGDAVRTAAVAVAAVAAEGGDFDMDVVPAHDDDAEVGTHGLGAGEEFHDLLGRGAGGDVEIFGFAAEEHVAHAAACQQGLVTGLRELFDDLDGGGAHEVDLAWREWGVNLNGGLMLAV